MTVRTAGRATGLARALSPVPAVGPGPVADLLLEHFYRGARIQRVLRLALVAFFVATLLLAPPDDGLALVWVIVGCYAVWAVVTGLLVAQATAAAAPYVWLALLFDVLATSAVTLVADTSAEQTVTAFVVVNGFFVLPVLAAAQLNPWVCAVVSGVAVATYLGSSAATHHDETEPWWALFLRTFLLAVVGVGCVLLSLVQRQRVLSISQLASDRSRLVAELVDLEERERRTLAENLHDGALQYVLAARQDLGDVQDAAPPGAGPAVERVDHALGEAVTLLRSTLTQLHPAVVQEAGLLPAMRDLVRDTGRRGRLEVGLVTDRWDESTRTPVDLLLLGTARELLTNVVKHAGATRAQVDLSLLTGADGAPLAELVVSDDGRGFAPTDLESRLGAGHLGLASRRIHVEAAGGRLRVVPVRPSGTRVEVVVPLR